MRVTIEDGTERIVIDGGTLAKSAEPEEWDGTGVATQVIKATEESRFTLALAYPALRSDAGVAQDGFRDFASAEAVEKAAWSYLQKSPRVGLWHAQGTDGAGDCVESYVYRGPDWQISAPDGSAQVVKSGDWLVGIVWTPETWRLIKSGQVRGVSMQGSAVRRKPSAETLAALRQNEGVAA
jgi:Putative phage serine protease XkdF